MLISTLLAKIAAYMKTNRNANADASANNNTNTRINTNITERARRTPKIRITSRTRWHQFH